MKNILRMTAVYSLLLSSIQAQQIYWTDPGTHKVQRANSDGSQIEDIAESQIVTPTGIALDLSGGKIYWADEGTGKIKRSNLNGSAVQNLVAGLNKPQSAALHLSTGKMYWTDFSNSQLHIRRANLDGSEIEILIVGSAPGSSDLFSPGSISLDVTGGKMYWTERWLLEGTSFRGGAIRRANLNGTNAETLFFDLSPTADSPKALAVHSQAGKLYWSNQSHTGGGHLRRCNLDGSGMETFFSSQLPGADALALDLQNQKIYLSSEAGEQITRCSLNGNDFEIIFLTTASPFGLAVDTNSARMYWSSRVANQIRRVNINGSGETALVSPNHAVTPFGIALDRTGDKIYLTDPQSRKVWRANFNGSSPQSIYQPDGDWESQLWGIAIDRINQKISFTDRARNSIYRTNLDGSSVQTFGSAFLIQQPEGIAVDSEQEKMVWGSSAVIGKGNFDGSEMEIAVGPSFGTGKSVALHPIQGKIYWTNDGGIHRAKLDGSEMEMLLSNQQTNHAKELALDLASGKIYWTANGEIRRANLNGTQNETFVSGLLSPQGIALLASTTSAPVRVDLRPNLPAPPGGYEPNTLITVEVFLVDTESLGGNFLARSVGFDFRNRTGTLNFPYAGCQTFRWEFIPGDGIEECDGKLPRPVNNSFIPGGGYTLPLGGEVKVGEIDVNVGCAGGVLDIMNAAEPNPNAGAFLAFGFGGPGDPVTIWRAFTGDIIGGVLDVPVNGAAPMPSFEIAFSNPPNGAIEARSYAPFNLPGWSGIDVTFTLSEKECTLPTLFADEFTVLQAGSAEPVPVLAEVIPLPSNSAKLYFGSPFVDVGTRVTVVHNASGSSVCLGWLPGDVNGDARSTPYDILALINAINGVVPRPLYSTDMNRSGVAEPSDILYLIDLLNGAGWFNAWNGVSLPGCPN